MNKNFFKTLFFTAFVMFSSSAFGQLSSFNNKLRMQNLEDFDDSFFTWGFYLAGNMVDYKLSMHPQYGISTDRQKSNLIHSKTSVSFGAGLTAKFRMNEWMDLRLEPGLHFVERKLTFETMDGKGTLPALSSGLDRVRSVKSTYVDVPLLLEIHGERWNNTRPYIAFGGNYLANIQSNSRSQDDNQQGIFRSTTHNFGWTAELGLQIYFSKFKLTPAVRGTFLLNNELTPDNPSTPAYWAGALEYAKSRGLFFVLKFE